jgi:hypothetical protein
MSDVEKLTAKLAAQFMVARIGAGGATNDNAYAQQCLNLAKTIVSGSITK